MPQGDSPDRDQLRVLPLFTRWRRYDSIGRGRISTYWQTMIGRDAKLTNARMVIDLVFGNNRSIMIATEALRFTSALLNDQVYTAKPYLISEPDIGHDYSLGDATSSARSISISVHPAAVPLRELIARGEMLAGFAEVFLIGPDGNYDERYILMRGDMDGGIRFGAPDEAIDIDITDPRLTGETALPPWVLDTERWPSMGDAGAEGERCPIIVNSATGIPCHRIDTGTPDRYLVGYGHGYTLDGQYIDGVSSGVGSLVETVDGLGLPVTVISYATGITDDNTSVNVDVSVDTHGFNIIRAIEHLVVNYSQMGRAGLNSVLVAESEAKMMESGGGVASGVFTRESPQITINSGDATVLSYLEGTLLSEWPMVSMVWEGKGYGPILSDHRAPPVGSYTVGQLPFMDRTSGVEERAKADMLNSFIIRYNYDPIADIYKGVIVRNASNSVLCAWSRDQIGERYEGERQAITIHDANSAGYVVDWLVEHFARPSYYVEYTCFPIALLMLRRADTILFTDPEFSWSAERAIVERVGYQRGKCTIGLRIYPGFLNRATGAMRGYPAALT